jgi:hypothetical protein
MDKIQRPTHVQARVQAQAQAQTGAGTGKDYVPVSELGVVQISSGTISGPGFI